MYIQLNSVGGRGGEKISNGTHFYHPVGEVWGIMASYYFISDQLCSMTHLAQIKLGPYLLYNSLVDNYASIKFMRSILVYLYYCCSVIKLCLALCDTMECSTPGFPVLHYPLDFANNNLYCQLLIRCLFSTLS